MSATTATNSLTTTQQREREKQQRERERQRGLQFQDESVSFLPIGNSNVHFSGPIKHEHEDATAKRIKDTLGEFNQIKGLIGNSHKQLVNISTSLCRTKINNQAKKVKVEQILTEMKNDIQPLTGLEDGEINDLNDSNEEQLNNIHNSINLLTTFSTVNNHQSSADRSGGQLKELDLNSNNNNKPVNTSLSQPIKPPHHHSLYSEHSDQDLLDEVSDESRSSKHKLDSQSMMNKKPIKPIQQLKRDQLDDQQDENMNEESDSDSIRKKKKDLTVKKCN